MAELRECECCGKQTRRGGSSKKAYCTACNNTVRYPAEDKCPACGAENHMVIASTCCGARFRLVDEDEAA